MKITSLLGSVFLFLPSVFYASLSPIDRNQPKEFLKSTLVEGGSSEGATLKRIRFGEHADKNFERWVFDFSQDTKSGARTISPKFQVHFDGDRPEKPTLVLHLQSIDAFNLNEKELDALVNRSKAVTLFKIYPQVERGDMVIELELNPGTKLAAHQPAQDEGRIVLDFQ